LGIGHGAGFHCANAGQNTDYYNPYSAHNSALTAGYDHYNGNYQGYASFDSDTVAHSSYTGRDQDQHSVFESLPGQTVQPKFEPAVDRTRKKKQEATFDPDFGFDNDSDFDEDEEFDEASEFGSTSKSDFDLPSKLDDYKAADLASEGEGGFDQLKSNFDDVQDAAETQLKKSPAVGEESTFLD